MKLSRINLNKIKKKKKHKKQASTHKDNSYPCEAVKVVTTTKNYGISVGHGCFLKQYIADLDNICVNDTAITQLPLHGINTRKAYTKSLSKSAVKTTFTNQKNLSTTYKAK